MWLLCFRVKLLYLVLDEGLFFRYNCIWCFSDTGKNGNYGIESEVCQPWRWRFSRRSGPDPKCTAFVQEWAQPVAKRCLQQEEEKEERFFPLNLKQVKRSHLVTFSSYITGIYFEIPVMKKALRGMRTIYSICIWSFQNRWKKTKISKRFIKREDL